MAKFTTYKCIHSRSDMADLFYDEFKKWMHEDTLSDPEFRPKVMKLVNAIKECERKVNARSR